MGAETACLLALVGVLAAISLIDIRSFRIPDALTYPLIALGVLCAMPRDAEVPAVAGAALGYLIMVTVELAYRRFRGRDGLGRGDAKLFAAAGAWVGPAGLPYVLLLAATAGLLAALVLGRRDQPVPFGPFLGMGLLTVVAAQRLSFF